MWQDKKFVYACKLAKISAMPFLPEQLKSNEWIKVFFLNDNDPKAM